MGDLTHRERFCPFAKTFGGSQQLVDGLGPFCVGKSCMAWQPAYQDRGAHGTHVESGGWCGLVGEPNRTNNSGRSMR